VFWLTFDTPRGTEVIISEATHLLMALGRTARRASEDSHCAACFEFDHIDRLASMQMVAASRNVTAPVGR